jgi:hypothetical protein
MKRRFLTTALIVLTAFIGVLRAQEQETLTLSLREAQELCINE